MTGKSKQNRSTQETRTGESAEPRDEHCPVVGIGASAGGLAAFEAFFSALPADTDPGMAFILVQHLAPDHESMLSDLIRRYTRMQVCEVEDGMTVQPNSIYIIPPNRDMALLNGRLQLLEPAAPRGHRFPIDFFFRSLAQDRHERAIGIILSGTGSDGTQGARAIKAEGGLVMAQTPGTAGYDGMPLSALGTGLVDYELPPAEMPAQLKDYVDRAFSKPVKPAPDLAVENENALQKIFVILRTRIGHDFSAYKPSTIHRRIERRMAIHRIETMSEYVKFLQQTPAEGDALFHDLLIGVTGFFRDPAAFQALEQLVLPPLFADKPADAVIRAWVPGCSTGEEAYSLAIFLHEHLAACKQNCRIQIFATDIDNDAVAVARASIYPTSIAADISPERLARYFTIEPDGNAYRLHKKIRDLVIFSGQDVLKDPPFSRIDLISCRNLMIYLRAEVQKKLILLFHYALNPGGFLFLGTSETVGDAGELFTVLDRKSKIYRKEPDPQRSMCSPQPVSQGDRLSLKAPTGFTEQRPKPVQLSLGALTEQTMLKQIAPAAALVNRSGDILYLHGRTGMYLEPSPGETGVNNILKMARQGLRDDLAISLHKAAGSTATVHRFGLRVLTNGDYTAVNLTVCPVTSDTALPQGEPLFLVILQEAPPLEPGQMQQAAARALAGTDGSEPDTDGSIEALRQELRVKEEYLQAANEELKAANEELKSSKRGDAVDQRRAAIHQRRDGDLQGGTAGGQ
jgi:two-component system, chemotaxis family, CheB/CheR fusion protein